MRKLWIIGLLAVLLCGCAQVPLETVSDFCGEPSVVPACRIQLDFPKEAAKPVMESGENQLYLCDGYELRLQSLPAGNLSASLQDVTGFPAEKLTVIHTDQDGNDRSDLVWSTAGEEGNLVGRAAVIDDGNYYYCVSVLAAESRTEAVQESWQRIFDSFTLG